MSQFVIVVDDRADAHNAVKSSASELQEKEDLRFEVVDCYSLDEGSKMARQRKPDIVVMDFQESEGWETARKISREYGAEIIIFTGSPELAKRRQAISPLPGVRVIEKPAPDSTVRSTLRAAALQHAKQERYASAEFRNALTNAFTEARNKALRDDK